MPDFVSVAEVVRLRKARPRDFRILTNLATKRSQRCPRGKVLAEPKRLFNVDRRAQIGRGRIFPFSQPRVAGHNVGPASRAGPERCVVSYQVGRRAWCRSARGTY